MPTLQQLGATAASATFPLNGPAELRLEFARPFDVEREWPVGSPFQLTDERDSSVLFTGHVWQPSDSARPAERHILIVRDYWQRRLAGRVYTAPSPWGVDTRILLGGEQVVYQSDETEADPIDPEDVYQFDGLIIEADPSLTESIERILIGVPGENQAVVDLPTSRMVPTWIDGLTRDQAILQVLRNSAAAYAYYDRTGIFHAAETGAPYPLAASDCESITLTDRDDIRIPGVRVIFRKLRTSNLGTIRLPHGTQSAGNPDAENALIFPLDLAPERRSLSDAYVRVRAVDPTSLEWWMAAPEIGPRIAAASGESWFRGPINPTITRHREDPDGTLEVDEEITHEIVRGQIPETWQDPGCTGPHGRRANIVESSNTRRVKVGTIRVSAVFQLSPATSVSFVRTVRACDLTSSGRYVHEDRTVADLGEFQGDFNGLASTYLDGVNGRQWQGTLTLQPPATGIVIPPPIGRDLQLTGWRPELEGVALRVTGVEQEFFTGRTTLQVGPIAGEEIGDLVERIRAFRDGRKRPPRLTDTESSEPPRGASPGSTPPSTANTSSNEEPANTQGFALNAEGNADIHIVPSECWGYVPSTMDPIAGQDLSVGSSGACWIRIVNDGGTAEDITIETASEYPEEVPAGETHYKLGSWERVTDSLTSQLVLRITQIRYGPIDRPGAPPEVGPWRTLVRPKPDVPGTWQWMVTDGQIVGTEVEVDDLDEWEDLPSSDVYITLHGEFEPPSLAVTTLAVEAATTEWPEEIIRDEDSPYGQTDFHRRLAEIIYSDGEAPTVRRYTMTPLELRLICSGFAPARWPRPY